MTNIRITEGDPFLLKNKIDRKNSMIRDIRLLKFSASEFDISEQAMSDLRQLVTDNPRVFSRPSDSDKVRSVGDLVGRLQNIRMDDKGLLGDMLVLPHQKHFMDVAETMSDLVSLVIDAHGSSTPATENKRASIHNFTTFNGSSLGYPSGFKQGLFESIQGKPKKKLSATEAIEEVQKLNERSDKLKERTESLSTDIADFKGNKSKKVTMTRVEQQAIRLKEDYNAWAELYPNKSLSDYWSERFKGHRPGLDGPSTDREPQIVGHVADSRLREYAIQADETQKRQHPEEWLKEEEELDKWADRFRDSGLQTVAQVQAIKQQQDQDEEEIIRRFRL